MSIPLINSNNVNDINTSLIAIKKEFNYLDLIFLKLKEKIELNNISDIDFLLKSDLTDDVESGNENPVTSNGVNSALESSAEDLKTSIFNIVHPKGEVYVQYPMQKSPQELWGSISTWTDITSTYDGAFFRAYKQGTSAAFADSTATTATKQINQNAYHRHTMSHTHTINNGNTSTAGTVTTAGIRHAISAATGGNWAFDVVARQSSRSAYSVTNTVEGSGSSYQKLTSSNSGAASRITHNGHPHSISGSSYIYGRTDEASNSNTSYNGNSSNTEARPDNYAIRLWKRTS